MKSLTTTRPLSYNRLGMARQMVHRQHRHETPKRFLRRYPPLFMHVESRDPFSVSQYRVNLLSTICFTRCREPLQHKKRILSESPLFLRSNLHPPQRSHRSYNPFQLASTVGLSHQPTHYLATTQSLYKRIPKTTSTSTSVSYTRSASRNV